MCVTVISFPVCHHAIHFQVGVVGHDSGDGGGVQVGVRRGGKGALRSYPVKMDLNHWHPGYRA